MGKTPVRMKAVVYALSPFQQKVMPGLWKDITTKIHHKVTENWISATLLVTPVVGTYQGNKATYREFTVAILGVATFVLIGIFILCFWLKY